MPKTTSKGNGRHRLADVAKQQPAPDAGFSELGQTGLLRYSGYINEEFHRDLTGDRALKIYKEMSTNSATVGACLFAVEKLMRGTSFFVQPGGDSNDDLRAKDLIETSLHDMSQSWHDCLAEILTMLTYGWSYHEQVYKYRRGPQRDAGQSSRHDDGLIGWRKLPIRSQDSRTRWEFDASGGIKGMYQQPVTAPRELFIPIEKALLFRPNVHKNNPEGRSVLRTAYRSWYYVKRIEEIEAIGIERDLAGYPMGFVPAELLSGTRSSGQASIYNALKNFVVNIRRDEQEGGLWPMAYDSQGKPLYDFKLLSTGGTRQFNTTEVIQRYNREIAMSVMADFLFLGSTNVGSWALGAAKTSLFGAAVDSMLDQVDDVMNRHAIPRLLGLNGFRLEKLPELKHSNVESVDLNTIASMVTALSGAGARLFPDLDLENHFRNLLGWPEMTEEGYDEREADQVEAEQRQADAKAELLRANEERMQTDAQGRKPTDDEPTEKREAQHITVNVPAAAQPNIQVPVTIAEGAIKVDTPAPVVNVAAPNITMPAPFVHVEPAKVNVAPAQVQVTPQINVTIPRKPGRYVLKGKDGQTSVIEVHDGS